VGRCWSAALLYCAAVQLARSRSVETGHGPGKLTRRGSWQVWTVGPAAGLGPDSAAEMIVGRGGHGPAGHY
jgi:hypothetical protein